MKKFIRHLLLGIAAYHGFFALLVGMLGLILQPGHREEFFNLGRILYAYGLSTAIFGGFFVTILIMAGIAFSILCLINKISPIERFHQIDEEENSKEFMEQFVLKWREEFKEQQKDDWDEFIKEKTKNL
jgi:hypothetical protein